MGIHAILGAGTKEMSKTPIVQKTSCHLPEADRKTMWFQPGELRALMDLGRVLISNLCPVARQSAVCSHSQSYRCPSAEEAQSHHYLCHNTGGISPMQR